MFWPLFIRLFSPREINYSHRISFLFGFLFISYSFLFLGLFFLSLFLASGSSQNRWPLCPCCVQHVLHSPLPAPSKEPTEKWQNQNFDFVELKRNVTVSVCVCVRQCVGACVCVYVSVLRECVGCHNLSSPGFIIILFLLSFQNVIMNSPSCCSIISAVFRMFAYSFFLSALFCISFSLLFFVSFCSLLTGSFLPLDAFCDRCESCRPWNISIVWRFISFLLQLSLSSISLYSFSSLCL